MTVIMYTLYVTYILNSVAFDLYNMSSCETECVCVCVFCSVQCYLVIGDSGHVTRALESRRSVGVNILALFYTFFISSERVRRFVVDDLRAFSKINLVLSNTLNLLSMCLF